MIILQSVSRQFLIGLATGQGFNSWTGRLITLISMNTEIIVKIKQMHNATYYVPDHVTSRGYKYNPLVTFCKYKLQWKQCCGLTDNNLFSLTILGTCHNNRQLYELLWRPWHHGMAYRLKLVRVRQRAGWQRHEL